MNLTYKRIHLRVVLLLLFSIIMISTLKAEKGYISTSPTADSTQTIVVDKNQTVTFSIISGLDTITSASGTFENTGGTFDGSFDTVKVVTFGSAALGHSSKCTITLTTTGSHGEPCSTSKTITFHVIVPEVTVKSYTLCDGKNAVKLDLKPVTTPPVSGTLSVSFTSSGGDTEVINKPNQQGQVDLKPDLDFTKFPTGNTAWSKIKAKWTINLVDYKSDDYLATFRSKQMNCTGYYTALDSAFSGGNGTFWVGGTQYTVHQSFLDAIVRMNGGSVQVLEGVGLLSAGATTYYHFAAADQVVSGGSITKYVATSNGHDGDCDGTGHALTQGVSVAKKDSSSYFTCGANLYIANNDGTVSGVCHKVEDSGHAIDSPDIFQGQGNSSLDSGPGNEIVLY